MEGDPSRVGRGGAEAYGWPGDLSDEEILTRLVALNAERAEEERRGMVRWLRPEFQNPTGQTAAQGTLGLKEAVVEVKGQGGKAAKKADWPKSLAEQARAVRTVLMVEGKALSVAEVAKRFKGARAEKVGELLEILAMLGQARGVGEGEYVA